MRYTLADNVAHPIPPSELLAKHVDSFLAIGIYAFFIDGEANNDRDSWTTEELNKKSELDDPSDIYTALEQLFTGGLICQLVDPAMIEEVEA